LGQDGEPGGFEASLDKEVEVVTAGGVDSIHGTEEPTHVAPGQVLQGGAAAELPDREEEGGMADSGHRNAEELASGEPCEA
jgi:hypothetical protein